jgi:hypothetical protein
MRASGSPQVADARSDDAGPPRAYVNEFLASSHRLALTKTFMRIKPNVNRRIVALVEELAGEQDD